MLIVQMNADVTPFKGELASHEVPRMAPFTFQVEPLPIKGDVEMTPYHEAGNACLTVCLCYRL
jgi:hypothetical protein